MVSTQEEDVESLSIRKGKQKCDEFGLWVKLEIPDEGGQGEDINLGDQKVWSDIKRVCHICHKEFSSGKALGGHMRIHVQRAKKDLVFKKELKVRRTIKFKKQNSCEEAEEKVTDIAKKTNGNYYGGSDNVIKKPTCTICCKDFRSMKSLFGHMRCHPDRDWRGIHPPSSVAKNSSSSSSLSDAAADPPKIDDQMKLLASGEKNKSVDLTESLRGWPVTGRRGSNSMRAASSSELSSLEDDELIQAANYLLMLARGNSLVSEEMQRQKFVESKAEMLEINQVSKSKRQMIDQSSAGIRIHSPVEQLGNEKWGFNEVEKAGIAGTGLESVNKLEGQGLLEEHEHNYFSDDDSKNLGQLNDMDLEGSSSKEVLIKNKKKRKKMKLCDLELAKNASPVTLAPVHQKAAEMTSTTPSPDKYKCKTCDKWFTTHQALGGHRSSHNKTTIVIQNAMEENANPSNPTVQLEEITKGLVKGTRHQCMICHKNFSTAQALGAHKGSHGSGQGEASSSRAPSSGDVCRSLMDIDLNEMPPLED